jgi:membrane protein implicated in regulation of membrane protease activity
MTFYLLRPLWWPRWLRRVALVMFPIAVPLWLAILVLAGAALLLAAVSRPLRRFWNDPRRINGYGYFQYSGESAAE